MYCINYRINKQVFYIWFLQYFFFQCLIFFFFILIIVHHLWFNSFNETIESNLISLHIWHTFYTFVKTDHTTLCKVCLIRPITINNAVTYQFACRLINTVFIQFVLSQSFHQVQLIYIDVLLFPFKYNPFYFHLKLNQ